MGKKTTRYIKTDSKPPNIELYDKNKIKIKLDDTYKKFFLINLLMKYLFKMEIN